MSPLLSNIIFGILLIIIVYLVYSYFLADKSKHLSKLKSGKKSEKIEASKVATNKNSNNFAYSIWFYVSDWQYKLTEPKILFQKKSNDGKNSFNPNVELAAYQNNLDITIDTYYAKQKTTPTVNKCSISNFPLQRWVNLIISLNGRTLDVYIDGKLVKTCVLPGIAIPLNDSDIQLTPDGGFDGWTSKFKFWGNPLNPQEAYNVYKEGPGGSSLFSIFDKYKLKVTYLVDNVDEGDFTI